MSRNKVLAKKFMELGDRAERIDWVEASKRFPDEIKKLDANTNQLANLMMEHQYGDIDMDTVCDHADLVLVDQNALYDILEQVAR